MSVNGQPQPLAGVVTVPPSAIHDSIKRQVAESLKGVKEGQTMVVMSLHTHAGVNLAVAHKFTDHFEVVAWVGKSGWDQPLTKSASGGVSFTYSR